ncbi:MAG: hypothetical protein ABEI57_05685 [Halapricum sp.]
MSTDSDTNPSTDLEARGVPDCLELEPELGHIDTMGYRCQVCGEPIYGTPNARNHGCVPDDPCPACGSMAAQPDIGASGDLERVDECERCGTVFRSGGADDS